MRCVKNAPPMNIGTDPIDLSKDAEILRSGPVRIRGLGRVSKRLWKQRHLTLVENALLIEHHSLSQRLLKRIPLKSITKVERVDLTHACLLIESSGGKQYYLAFENDAILYDWQDDIYPRSRLGNFSSPFNFIHEVHLTSNDLVRNSSRLSALRNRMQPRKRRSSVIANHRTSSELNHKQTYHEPFSPQRASYDSYTKKPTSSHKRTNSGSSSSTCRFVFDSSIHPTGGLASSSPSVLLEGLYQVKRTGKRTLFAFWRSQYVVLTARTLQIRKSQTSLPEVTIQLPHIIDVSQLKSNSRPFVLRLMTRDNRKYHISLPNTSDLDKWFHCIASRSRRRHISEPDGFEFHVHVSWDSKSQAFTVSKGFFFRRIKASSVVKN
ncbi:hypothetical protein AN958_07775 [Leucoagaricus sp. SymC.cos]|nr:hypothetical protein AN958_07775 [Leucoagaricus sp. SymC.cos]